MTKRVVLLVSSLLIGGCAREAADVAAQAAPGAPTPNTKITFNMSWLPQGSMAGVIVAIDQGFYAEKHLDVEAVRGFGGIRTTNEVDQGMFDFGYGDPVAVVLNRAKGGNARLVAVINDSWPAGLCYLSNKRQLKRPSDLKGLTIGGGQNSAVQAMLPPWLERNGVKASEVKILQLNPSVIVASLIEGTIDAAECWRGNSRPLFAKEAAAAGHTLDWIEYRPFNLDIHGSGIIATDKTISERPEVVRSFVEATFRGYLYARDNPTEARAIMLKRYPQLDPAVTGVQIEEIMQLVFATPTPGRVDPAKMERTVEFIAAAYPLETRPNATDVYTNQFLTPR
jgi:NitT/TauT family transport system substrate-binding protein